MATSAEHRNAAESIADRMDLLRLEPHDQILLGILHSLCSLANELREPIQVDIGERR